MLLKIAGLVVAALALASCSSTSVTTGYYEVSGKTGSQLDRSIARNGPMGGHAFAATQVQILPVALKEKIGPEGCSVRTASFRVSANITYPRWVNRDGASRELKQGFDVFSDYARLHEQVHVRIAEAAARTMEAEAYEIPPQKDCDRLAFKVKAMIAKVQKQHHKAQLAFDAAEDKRLKALFAKAKSRQ